MNKLNFWMTIGGALLFVGFYLETHIDRDLLNCTVGTAPIANYILGQDKTIADPALFEPSLVIGTKGDHSQQFWKSYWQEYYHHWVNNIDEPSFVDTSAKGRSAEFDSEAYHNTITVAENYEKEIDSLSILYQESGLEIWIINNTNAPIHFLKNMAQPVCIKEAQTKTGKWQPIEFFYFNDLYRDQPLSSYMIDAGKAKSILTLHQNKGSYKTLIRYKIVGTENYYYSNSFSGFIDYCDFKNGELSIDESLLPPR